ncbi:hypothetical protein AAC387_Pa05g2501 [Persea americana]
MLEQLLHNPQINGSAAANSAIPILEIPQNPIPEIDPKPTATIPETPKASFADRQTKPSFPKEEGEKIPTFISAYETSEFSEIRSVSETILTATIAEKRDGEENSGDEVKMRPKELISPAKKRRKRSFSGNSTQRIERRAKSPARRSDPSSTRSTPVREMGWMNRSQTLTGNAKFRRDTAEGRFWDFKGSLELE